MVLSLLVCIVISRPMQSQGLLYENQPYSLKIVCWIVLFVYVVAQPKLLKLWQNDKIETFFYLIKWSFKNVIILKDVFKTRAQTHSPPQSVQISFLLHHICRICHSSPTAVPGLQPGWDVFFLSVLWNYKLVTFKQVGHMTMARLT